MAATLSNIIGLAHVLAQTESDQNIKNLCQMILESATQLDNVIRSIGGLAYEE